MKITIKEHVRGGLIDREVIDMEKSDDPIFNMQTIVEAYPGLTIRDMSFFSWGDINVYLSREEQ